MAVPARDGAAGRPVGAFSQELLKRAPSVWAQSATIREQLVHAGHDSPMAPAVYAVVRVGLLVVFPVISLALFQPNTIWKTFMLAISAAFMGLVLPVGYLLRAVR